MIEYRVETRQTMQHPSGQTGWWPEGDHRTFPNQGAADDHLARQRAWYDNPEFFEHRVTARTVTPWAPVYDGHTTDAHI